MKKMRKGFTLVELLIVVAILGALSAAMTASVGNSTATAKAAAIAGNVDVCITAAKVYYAENANDPNLKESVASSFLTADYISNWEKLKNTGGGVSYAASDSNKGPTGWAVTVNFSTAPDAKGIATALKKIPGYNTFDATSENYILTVTLLTGAISPEAAPLP